MFHQHESPVGCDYRAELQKHIWAGSQAGGCVVGEVQKNGKQQPAPRAAAVLLGYTHTAMFSF